MNKLVLVLGCGGSLNSTILGYPLHDMRQRADEGGEDASEDERAAPRPLDGLDDFAPVLDATFRG